MRVKRITTKDPGQNVLLNYEYNYDKMDNITAKDTEHGEYGYDYDDLYRLIDTSITNQTNGTNLTNETYSYDQVGNRLTSEDTTSDWAYNPNNELGGYDEVSHAYDDNGNLTNKTSSTNVTNYTYNLEDRLTQVWDGEVGTGSLTATYYYDPFGRRLWKDVGGTRTHFLYADEGLVGEYDATGAEIKTYSYKPGSTWTTDPLFMKQGTQYYFYHNDHLGTPQKMTSVNGAIHWRAKYSSFGKAEVGITSTITNNLRFPGQYYDSESGLHYNYFRYYLPTIGRYLTPDPVGLSGGINLFYYAENNPINLTDPLGLDAIRVVYLGYPVNTGYRNIHLPLGHAAVIAVDPKTGYTRYYEYGRYGGDFGKVMRRPVPNLEMDDCEKPTDESLKKLYDYISEKYGKGYPVLDKYYSDADYQKVVNYAEQIKNDPNREPYCLPSNTCYTFSSKAIKAGRE